MQDTEKSLYVCRYRISQRECVDIDGKAAANPEPQNICLLRDGSGNPSLFMGQERIGRIGGSENC